MTFETPTTLLMLIGMFVGFGTLVSVIAILWHRTSLSRTADRWAFLGGSVCALGLAAVLFNDPVKSRSIQIILWRLFSFQEPEPVALEFGLDATWFKAAIVSLIGGLFFLSEWSMPLQEKESQSDDVRLSRSFLYFAMTSFLLSPNLPQSLLSWGASALLVRSLVRPPMPSNSPPGSKVGVGKLKDSRPTAPSTTVTVLPERRTAIPVDTSPTTFESHRWQIFFRGLRQISERFERVWVVITFDIPNWLGEQSEILCQQSDSIILLGTVSGMFAVLLTWLTVG